MSTNQSKLKDLSVQLTVQNSNGACKDQNNVETLVDNAETVTIESRLDSLETLLTELKSVLVFIQKERTSPRGRIDAMMTNTQHILDNMTIMKKQLNEMDNKMNRTDEQICELNTSLRYDIVNLTDEFTRLRIALYNHLEKDSDNADE